MSTDRYDGTISMSEFRRRRSSVAPVPNPFDDDTINENDTYTSSRSAVTRGTNSEMRRRGSSSLSNNHNESSSSNTAIPHDPLLDLYERRLHEDVDSDFFHDPDEFQALNRVIDIIGDEIGSGGGNVRVKELGALLARQEPHLERDLRPGDSIQGSASAL